jgi:CRISPR type III-B/RAMP module-associated protein Cmr5
MPTPEKKTLEQRRAELALAKIDQVVRKGADLAKYKSQLLKLPARLHTNGLGQTSAFYLAAGKGKPEWEICSWLETWLAEQEIYSTPGQDLIHRITEGSETLYRRASTEARALAVWLKRFAEAFIQDEEKKRGELSAAAAGAGESLPTGRAG